MACTSCFLCWRRDSEASLRGTQACHKGRMPLTAASGNVRYASDPLWRREETAPRYRRTDWGRFCERKSSKNAPLRVANERRLRPEGVSVTEKDLP